MAGTVIPTIEPSDEDASWMNACFFVKNNLSLAVTSERALPLPAGRIERHLAGCRQGEGEPGYWNANGVNPSFYWSFANPQFWSTAPLILRSLGAVCKTPE